MTTTIDAAGSERPIRWKLRRSTVDVTRRALIMGILNVTPDSFSDGGHYTEVGDAVGRALAMIDDGADIIDIGGESTRPGATPVGADEELDRILPVIQLLRAQSDVAISIDTMKATVAHAALEAGADIVNDVSGLTADPAMAPTAREFGAGVVIMHMRGAPRTMQKSPHYDDVVREVGDFLRQQAEAAISCGIDPMCIALDPGIGFGKSPDHNRALISATPVLAEQGHPILHGISRKSYLGWAADAPEAGSRLWAGVAATSLGRELGARVFRVHDVRAHAQALRMTEAILYGV